MWSRWTPLAASHAFATIKVTTACTRSFCMPCTRNHRLAQTTASVSVTTSVTGCPGRDADNPRQSSNLHWCCTSRAPDLHRHSSRLQHARGLFSKLSSHARARLPSAHRCALRASCFLEVHGSGFRRRDRGATRAHAATVIVSYISDLLGTVPWDRLRHCAAPLGRARAKVAYHFPPMT